MRTHTCTAHGVLAHCRRNGGCFMERTMSYKQRRPVPGPTPLPQVAAGCHALLRHTELITWRRRASKLVVRFVHRFPAHAIDMH